MEKNESKELKFISIQALRAWAFLGIFLSHVGSAVKWPSLGVCVFFTLSGFLLYRKHSNDVLNLSFGSRARFSWTRISKLYPLHIITMCFAVVLEMASKFQHGITLLGVAKILAKIILNISLTQTWVPNHDINVSLNGVAWYLSVTMFLYFMFPRICMRIRNTGKKALLLICVGILIVEIAVCIPWIITLGTDSKIYKWFMYCFPVFRMGDFFIGCSLAKWYFESDYGNHNKSIVISSLKETAALIVTIAVFMLLKIKSSNIFVLAVRNATTIYIPMAAIWIILFAENKGIITRALSNRVTIFIGNISAYLFLIHFVVTRWVGSIMGYLHYEPHGVIKWSIIVVELVLSVALSLIYKKYKDRNSATK